MKPFVLLAVAGAALATVLGLSLSGSTQPLAQGHTHKIQAPVDLQLRLVSSQPAQGRYQVEVRARLEGPMTGTRLTVRLPEGLRLVQGTAERKLALQPGQLLTEMLTLETKPGEGATLVVNAVGNVGEARLVKAAELDLGPVQRKQLQGKTRVDDRGQAVFEVGPEGKDVP